MQQCPHLLSDRAKAVVVDLIKVENPDEINQDDSRDYCANLCIRVVFLAFCDARHRFDHADDAFTHENQRQKTEAFD